MSLLVNLTLKLSIIGVKAVKILWVIIAPLGSPVVPEVKQKVKASSLLIFTIWLSLSLPVIIRFS